MKLEQGVSYLQTALWAGVWFGGRVREICHLAPLRVVLEIFERGSGPLGGVRSGAECVGECSRGVLTAA